MMSMIALLSTRKATVRNKDLTEYKNETAPSMQNIKLQKPHLSKITFRRHKNLLQQKKLAVNSPDQQQTNTDVSESMHPSATYSVLSLLIGIPLSAMSCVVSAPPARLTIFIRL
ncbi:hypothetical protein JKX24_21290 [Serratia proteamaculans]|uniref:Uncharacterized protein n=1 Tax=Serratia proteamaculans TaxID=28151 RepID=A0A7U0RN27_SERPR|nr:hypothetical protein [Serratia proteamaculans]MBO1504373.1 hypothetical protein [Serratia proteamaculans]MDW5512450.1 hypothetical protein [Serratia proteamaculans]QQX52683.1 hypothetical protein JKX24_21290 [Serratia proteamaculans]